MHPIYDLITPIESCQEMKRRFLRRFFQATRISILRREIKNIVQLEEENPTNYWNRFNSLYS